MGGGCDRPDDVHRPGVEVLLVREFAERVRPNQRCVVYEQLRDTDAIDYLIERSPQSDLVGDVCRYTERVGGTGTIAVPWGSGRSARLDQRSRRMSNERAFGLDLVVKSAQPTAVALHGEARDGPDNLAQEVDDRADV